MTPQRPPPGYRWEPGYQAYYHNPGNDYHGHKVRLDYPDPCGLPGWSVTILDRRPGECEGMCVDDYDLWIYGFGTP